MFIKRPTGETVVTTVGRQYDATINVIERLAHDTGRPLTSSFFGALHDRLVDPSDAIGQQHSDALQRSIAKNPHYTPLNFARNHERSVTAMSLWRRDDNRDVMFPRGRTTRQSWYEDLDIVFSSPFNQLVFNQILDTNVNTNVGRRAALVVEVMAAFAITGDIRMVEIGSSQGLIGLKLANHRNKRHGVGMSKVSVMDALGDNPAQYYRNEAQSQLATDIARNHPLTVSSYLGIDVQDPRDSIVKLKALRSSFYLEEMIKDWRRVREYDKLLDLQSATPQVESMVADASEPINPETVWQDHPAQAGGADIGTLMYTLYLIAPEKRATAVNNLLGLLHDKAVAILFDAIDVSPDGKMDVVENWSPYTSTVSVFDKANPDLGWRKFFTTESGRAIRWVNEAPLADMTGARKLGMLPTRSALGSE